MKSYVKGFYCTIIYISYCPGNNYVCKLLYSKVLKINSKLYWSLRWERSHLYHSRYKISMLLSFALGLALGWCNNRDTLLLLWYNYNIYVYAELTLWYNCNLITFLVQLCAYYCITTLTCQYFLIYKCAQNFNM